MRVVAGAFSEDARRRHPGRLAVFEREPEVLGEARLARAEEARDPDADALVRLVRRLRVALEDRREVRADRVGDDVLGELVAEDLLVGLVDLDDLFDVAVDVAREEVLIVWFRSSYALRQKILGR